MFLAIHGHDTPHPAIAMSLCNLENVYAKLGELDKALEKRKQSLAMFLAIHGHEKPHPDIAISLWNIETVHHMQKALNRATEFLERSLAMLRIVYAGNSQHPDIKDLQCALADVYDQRRIQDEVLAMRNRNERDTETDKISDGGSPSCAGGN